MYIIVLSFLILSINIGLQITLYLYIKSVYFTNILATIFPTRIKYIPFCNPIEKSVLLDIYLKTIFPKFHIPIYYHLQLQHAVQYPD